MRVEKPFPMMIRYELDDDQDGATRVAIHTNGAPGGFFGLAAPLITRQVRNSITADLNRLRDRLGNLTEPTLLETPTRGPIDLLRSPAANGAPGPDG